jgi:prepilin-type N-terminal cleavage/methylation domain-containing protein
MPVASSPSSRRRERAGFTLTELLIVIAIIAVLASLIAAAAINALRNAKRGRIVMDIQGMSNSIEQFKNDYGQYPPNGMNPGPVSAASIKPGTVPALVRSDFTRIFKTAFPRSQEPPDLIDALAGVTPASGTSIVTTGPVQDGLSAAEALYFWLGGFSTDEQYPISGDRGPSFTDAQGNNNGTLEPSDEVLENRNRRYEFDLSLLGPRTNGAFSGRSLQYKDPRNPNIIRQINFWVYTPKGSTQPFAYFDTSRYKPGFNAIGSSTPGTGRYDMWATRPASEGGPATAPWIVAFKQLREGVVNPQNANDYVFVNQKKFQILHAGLDDDWGSDSFQAMSMMKNPNAPIYFPAGPFVGAVSDNLSNFAQGTIADATQK